MSRIKVPTWNVTQWMIWRQLFYYQYLSIYLGGEERGHPGVQHDQHVGDQCQSGRGQPNQGRPEMIFLTFWMFFFHFYNYVNMEYKIIFFCEPNQGLQKLLSWYSWHSECFFFIIFICKYEIQNQLFFVSYGLTPPPPPPPRGGGRGSRR